MKIFVAIPTYDGKIGIETVRCLLNEQAASGLSGDELKVALLAGCSLIPMGRNQLAQEFMDSDADRLVFVDADVSWEPGALLKIAHASPDVVGGAYRYKQETEGYPVGWLAKKELWSDEHGLLEVASLPGGFLAINRSAFETLKAAHADRSYTHFGHKVHCFFHAPFADGRLYGEDAAFCRDWAECGGTIWLDPELTLTHWDGNRPYAGTIGRWLQGRAQSL